MSINLVNEYVVAIITGSSTIKQKTDAITIQTDTTLTDKEKCDKLAIVISKMNYNKRLETKVKDYAEQIINTENDKKEIFKKFIESSSVNGLIYAPTQVGKSAATIRFIESCFYFNVPVIVSTDNKNDQQEQLFNRIKDNLLLDNPVLIKASDRAFTRTIEKCVEDKFNNFIIFCLDNSSQIKKVTDLLSCCYTQHNRMSHVKQIAIIHDEGDTITKDSETKIINGEQAASHKKWLNLHNMINTQLTNIDLKRIFVTATPENCVALYDIKCFDVIKIEIPNEYTGYNNIKHISLDGDKNITELLKKEVQRIKLENTYEAILYCIERKIQNGQNDILEDLATKIKCVVNTYNGNGVLTYIPNKLSLFQNALDEEEIEYSVDGKFVSIPKITIRKFYSILKSIEEHCVVTIGKDLICRGISYVGEGESPLTATTMFYKPGVKMHNVGICQTIGRITGCAMPNLKRRLYSTNDIYTNYITYNKNQEKYIQKIQNNSTDNMLSKELINKLIFDKTSRPIERPKLNKKILENMNTEDFSSESSESESEDSNEIIDGVKISKLQKWINSSRLIIGKLIRTLYHNETLSFEELKDEINTTSKKLKHHIESGCSYRANKGYLWKYENNIISLNPKIKEYINENIEM